MTGAGVHRVRRARAALVFALAAFIAAFWIHFHTARPGTAFRIVNADPQIAYLISSLAVFDGQPYLLVQHPGTPLLVVGTVLIALAFPFMASSVEGLTTRLVQQPEVFVIPAHALLVLANLACVIALGWKALSVRRWSDAVLAAAVPASFFAFLPQSFLWTFYWSHNAVAFRAGTLLLLALLVALRRGRPPTARTAAALGLAAGALAATQLYFATWVIGLAAAPVVLARLRGSRPATALRPALVVIAASVTGFLVCCVPMIGSQRVFVDFVRALVTHQGVYGAGGEGIISAPGFGANLAAFWAYAPPLFVAQGVVFAMLVAVLVAERGRMRHNAGLWAVAAGLSLQWAATVLLLAKHPSPYYVPAVAAMFPPLLAVALALARRHGRAGRLCGLGLAAAVFIYCGRAAVETVASHTQRSAFRAAMTDEVDRFLARHAAAEGVGRDSVLVLWGPGVPDAGCYALWMGAQYSNNALSRQISRACPSEGLAWSNAAVLPEGWSAREGAPAVIVTTEAARTQFPAFAAFERGDAILSRFHSARGVRLEDGLVYTEPAEWHYPVRQRLGAALLEAGRAKEAETVYWADLARNPENGWSLFGLGRAL